MVNEVNNEYILAIYVITRSEFIECKKFDYFYLEI